MQTATIFNIQKFSLDDGPGIRTNVFFKGCPLRCAWCANPESQSKRPQLEWNRANCVGCSACAATDPAVTLEDGVVRVDHARVADPAAVAAACAHKALTVSGETKTVDEVFEVCMQDEPFYLQSGGGVTFSGGEATLWPDFIEELAERLAEKGVHTALETAGFADDEAFSRVAGAVDLVLFDVKHYDSALHEKFTGVATGPILRHLKELTDAGKDVLVRIPVIPGFNVDLENQDEAAAGFAEVLIRAGATKAQLLPFHNFGSNKYAMLGRAYDYTDDRNIRHEELEPLAAGLRARGIDARV
jgi:pyruvate formate lyase activating enzyme